MSSPQIDSYRPEIDGLRALAVLAVIVAHFDTHLMPSGFLGVDMFFVISGYVITYSLSKNTSSSLTGFLVGFYQRRVKRLVPALVLCVLVTSLLISLFNPNPNVSLRTGFSALFGLSNMYLLTQATDYFGLSAQLNVFTHTWSLGVEEQFYLLFPFLVWFGGIGRTVSSDGKGATLILSLLAVLSFIGFLLLHRTHPDAAYYLMPTRFWELSAGALVFLALRRTDPNLLARHSALLSLGSLLAILAVFLLPKHFVVYSTPALVALTMLLIASLRPATWTYRLFAHPAVVHIGLISYSLYLWHWSVLSLSRWTIGIHWWTAPIQLALMFLLAEASYRYLEKPLRRANWSRSGVKTIGLGLTTLIASAATLFVLAKVPSDRLYLGDQPALVAVGMDTLLNPYAMPSGGSVWKGRACVLEGDGDVGKGIRIEDCTLGDFDTASRRILVIGNSFGLSFVESFDTLVEKDGYAATITASLAASPVREIPNTGVRGKANSYYWDVIVPSLTERLRSGDLVFLIADKAIVLPRERESQSHERLAQFELGLTRLSEALGARGIGLVILHALPFVHEARCEPVIAAPQWFAPGGGPCRYLGKGETLERRAPLDAVLTNLQAQGKIQVVDLLDLFCPGEACTYHNEQGVMLYRDARAHPSVEAARLAAPQIREILLGSADVVGGDATVSIRDGGSLPSPLRVER
jgi:peptidoglycan/LPS O-acetylase OafA/YrhL